MCDVKDWRDRRRAASGPTAGAVCDRIYTTRPDTLFGATYMVLAPEHPLVDKITTPDRREAVEAYCRQARNKSDLERTELAKEKTGEFTGAYAVNPVNGKPIPIWVADYVLISYGTGAIMAVPAHDQRDWEFATKFNLPIIQVISGGRYLRPGLRGRRHADQLLVHLDEHRRPERRRRQEEDHRLAGRAGIGQGGRQVQAPRLALFPPAVLGRAVPDPVR